MPVHHTDTYIYIYICIIIERSELTPCIYLLCLLVCVNGLEEEEHGFDYNIVI